MRRAACRTLLQTPVGFCHESVNILSTSSYVNAVSELGSNEPPPQLYGGIIADPMGLGKTLTMIALAATDLSIGSPQGPPPLQQNDLDGHKPPVSATLIIVPPPRKFPLTPCISTY